VFALDHKVRVFVFQILDSEVQFLLLRHKPLQEWPLGPVIGRVGLGEHMREAAVREVREETGICRPLHLIDLPQPTKELFGDIGLVEWPFAYQSGGPSHPTGPLLPGPTVGELAWMGFEEAFQRLETPTDRETLVRLRVELQG
jgi:8-oxo-dGTP pyrophosphatase MutT (NUDIX family)